MAFCIFLAWIALGGDRMPMIFMRKRIALS